MCGTSVWKLPHRNYLQQMLFFWNVGYMWTNDHNMVVLIAFSSTVRCVATPVVYFWKYRSYSSSCFKIIVIKASKMYLHVGRFECTASSLLYFSLIPGINALPENLKYASLLLKTVSCAHRTGLEISDWHRVLRKMKNETFDNYSITAEWEA